MKERILYIILLFSFLTGKVEAQLSPGDLANSHKHLEGLSNCTQCHDLGSKVSNNKCLACHKEIKYRLDNKEGFHYAKDVKGKDCASCHSDHNGRNFDMVRFDEKTFNHTATGYELTGGHKKIDCRDCRYQRFSVRHPASAGCRDRTIVRRRPDEMPCDPAARRPAARRSHRLQTTAASVGRGTDSAT